MANMLIEERRTAILRILNEQHYAEVIDLAEAFGVTPVTIRRDLDEMDKEGLCIRKHGGAIVNRSGVTLEMPYNLKRQEMVDEKARIAAYAISLINDGNTFILDSGSTTYALALYLNAKDRITVVTNDLKITVKLAENPKIHLFCTGGLVRPSVFSLEGDLTESVINDMRVDMTFLGADAIHNNGRVSNVNIQEVPIKRAMIRACDKVILLADSTKFLNRGFVQVCSLNDIDILITDKGISEETYEMIKTYPLECVLV